MDDLHLREDQFLAEGAKGKLHPDEYRAIVREARRQIQEQLDETRNRTHLWLSRVISWLTVPYAPAKKWGLIYALDLSGHDELNLAEQALRVGCDRATISVHMQNFAKTFGVEPSRWMRDEEAVENSRKARDGYCDELPEEL